MLSARHLMGIGLCLLVVLTSGSVAPGGETPIASPPAATSDPRAEIEAGERECLSRLEALTAPDVLEAVARRLRPRLEAGRRRALHLVFGEEDINRFFAERDMTTDGYQERDSETVNGAINEVLALFYGGLEQDPETQPIMAACQESLAELAARRRAAGLPAEGPNPVEALRAANLRLAELLTPNDAKGVLVQNQQRGDLEPIEREGAAWINRYRVGLGLPPLLIDPVLCRAARGHSDEMARLNFEGHISPTAERRRPEDRARLAGYPEPTKITENVCTTWRPDNVIFPLQSWRTSPGHHRNLLAPHTVFGIGRAVSDNVPPPADGERPPEKGKRNKRRRGRVTRYWTAVFGGDFQARARAALEETAPRRPPAKSKRR